MEFLVWGTLVAAVLLLAGFVAGTHTSSLRIRVMETNLSLESARAMVAERERERWQTLATTKLADLLTLIAQSNAIATESKKLQSDLQSDLLTMHNQLKSAGHYRGKTEGEQLTPGWQAADRRESSPVPRPPTSFGAPT